MSHHNTVFSQILKLTPRHEFEALAKQHSSGRSFRTAARWSQFVTMAMAQLSGRNSLRDIVENMSAQAHRLYHLGSSKLSHSNLPHINEGKPGSMYEALFGKLLHRCQSTAPGHPFHFKNPLNLLDASTIDLCLSVFPRAFFRTTKGLIKHSQYTFNQRPRFIDGNVVMEYKKVNKFQRLQLIKGLSYRRSYEWCTVNPAPLCIRYYTAPHSVARCARTRRNDGHPHAGIASDLCFVTASKQLG